MRGMSCLLTAIELKPGQHSRAEAIDPLAGPRAFRSTRRSRNYLQSKKELPRVSARSSSA
jgi:hypothetical protein